jgi:hypothetical protein
VVSTPALAVGASGRTSSYSTTCAFSFSTRWFTRFLRFCLAHTYSARLSENRFETYSFTLGFCYLIGLSYRPMGKNVKAEIGFSKRKNGSADSGFPVAQAFTPFGDSFTHQHGNDPQNDEQDASAADHQDGGDALQNWEAKDHGEDADDDKSDWGEDQAARTDDQPVNQNHQGLEEERGEVGERIGGNHLEVGGAQ